MSGLGVSVDVHGIGGLFQLVFGFRQRPVIGHRRPPPMKTSAPGSACDTASRISSALVTLTAPHLGRHRRTAPPFRSPAWAPASAWGTGPASHLDGADVGDPAHRIDGLERSARRSSRCAARRAAWARRSRITGVRSSSSASSIRPCRPRRRPGRRRPEHGDAVGAVCATLRCVGGCSPSGGSSPGRDEQRARRARGKRAQQVVSGRAGGSKSAVAGATGMASASRVRSMWPCVVGHARIHGRTTPGLPTAPGRSPG